MEFQNQLRQNNHEFQSYIDSINQWRKSLDSNIENDDHENDGDVGGDVEVGGDLPPPLEEKKDKRISSFDYQKWDKYDADAAAQLVDRQIRKASRPVSQKEIKQARALKDRGNELFKNGDYSSALGAYLEALHLTPAAPALHFNCALMHLKLFNYQGALDACNAGLQYEPENVKGLWRKSIALRGLLRVRDAVGVVSSALKVEPRNKALLDELDKLKRVDPELRRELPIEEFGLPDTGEPEMVAEQSSSQRLVVEKVEEEATRSEPLVIEEVSESVSAVAHDFAAQEEQEKVGIELDVPGTASHFLRDWKLASAAEDTLIKYLQRIPPRFFSETLKSSFEPLHLDSILSALVSRCSGGSIGGFKDMLLDMAANERFKMNSLFLKRHVKKDLAALLVGDDDESVALIRSRYKLT